MISFLIFLSKKDGYPLGQLMPHVNKSIISSYIINQSEEHISQIKEVIRLSNNQYGYSYLLPLDGSSHLDCFNLHSSHG